MKSATLNDRNLAKIFLIPSILIILCLDFYPILFVMITSLQSRGLFAKTWDFVGFKNFLLVFREPNFFVALKNSVVWTLGTTSSEVILGTMLALLLNRKFMFRGLARALLLVPYVVPAVVSTLIWKYMFNDLFGLFNYVLQTAGIIKNPIVFLSSPVLAMIIVISVNVWTYTPFVIITVLAALQGIDPSLYDSARVDGAGPLKAFRYITVPSISPILIIVILLRTVWNFQKFDIIFLMTKGGPLMATTTLPIMVYNEAFAAYNLGTASTMAIMIFVILALVALLYIRLFEKVEEKVIA